VANRDLAIRRGVKSISPPTTRNPLAPIVRRSRQLRQVSGAPTTGAPGGGLGSLTAQDGSGFRRLCGWRIRLFHKLRPAR